MNKKYLNLSAEIQNYIEFAISDGKLSSNELNLIKRKAIEYGDDPHEVELVLSKLLSEIENNKKNDIVEYIDFIPKYGLLDSYFLGIKNYFNFKGRASRSQFWYFLLFNWLLVFTIFVIAGFQGEESANNETISILMGLFVMFFILFTPIPFLAICIRRLHDTNTRGWLILIPIYNIIILCKRGNIGNNNFGSDPYQSLKIEKNNYKNNFLNKIRSNTIETIGATMFAIGATSHEAIELKIIDYHQLDKVNKWLWLIGGILIVIPKTYKLIFSNKK